MAQNIKTKQITTGTATILGRTTAGTGDVEQLTGTQTTAMLDTATQSLKGLLSSADKTKLDGIAAGAQPGTVTAVSIATANGISGTSSGGTTPALTLTLGAITPSSVAATGAGSFGGTLSSTGNLTTPAIKLSSTDATTDWVSNAINIYSGGLFLTVPSTKSGWLGVNGSGVLNWTGTGTAVTGTLSATGALSASNFSGSSSGTNTGDQFTSIAQNTFIGSNLAGNNPAGVLTATQATGALNAMVGATGSVAGTKGLVPAPTTANFTANAYLHADGTFKQVAYTSVSGTPTLGTAASINTGTSGATIPLLNGANTWSAKQTVNLESEAILLNAPTSDSRIGFSVVSTAIGSLGANSTQLALSTAVGKNIDIYANGATLNLRGTNVQLNGTNFGSFATGTDAANLTGTVSVNRFNSGTGASASTFLAGDGTWKAAGVSDGDKGDVNVTNSGTTWTVESAQGAFTARNGQLSNATADSTGSSIYFGFSGADSYRHAIKSRHNAGNLANNALDFWLHKGDTDTINSSPSRWAATLDTAGLGVNGKLSVYSGSTLVTTVDSNGTLSSTGSFQFGPTAGTTTAQVTNYIDAVNGASNITFRSWNAGSSATAGIISASTTQGMTLRGQPNLIFNANGTEVGYASSSGWVFETSASFNASCKLTTAGSTTTRAGLNLPSGTAPSSPSAGDMWYNGTALQFYTGSTRTVAFTDSPTFTGTTTMSSAYLGVGGILALAPAAGGVGAEHYWGVTNDNAATLKFTRNGLVGGAIDVLKLTDTTVTVTGTLQVGANTVYTTNDASAANTASKLVIRDGSGNFSAATITATAVTATGTISAAALSGPLYNVRTGSKTLATDAITVASTDHYFVIDTEGAAATDDLVTINGATNGQIIRFRAASAARPIVMKTSGNLSLLQDMPLTSRYPVSFIYDGASWMPLGTGQPFAGAGSGLVPASAGGSTNFLRADATWANPLATPTLTGTVTASGGLIYVRDTSGLIVQHDGANGYIRSVTGTLNIGTAGGNYPLIIANNGSVSCAFPFSTSDTLTVEKGGGTAGANIALKVMNGTNYYMQHLGRMQAGSYNPITQVDDSGIIYSAGTTGTGNMVIASWNANANGVRFCSDGTTQFTSTGGNQIILKYGSASNPSVIFRNDGNTFYLLKTAASTLPNGTWDTARPLAVNLGDGSVAFGNTCTFNASMVSNSNFYAPGDNSQASIEARTPGAAGTTGGVRIRANSTDAQAILQITNTAASAEWAHVKWTSTGTATFSAAISGVGVYTAGDWFRVNGNGGVYWSDYNRGCQVTDAAGVTYGNFAVYGSGRNSWQGVAFGNANKTTLMTDGTTWGVHNTASGTGWMMQSDMSGNVTFAGNVTAYSDLRLKDNVREITDVEARRDTLAAAAIMYERDGRTRIGYGAQTLRDNGCGEFVKEAEGDAMWLATGTGTLSVDYGETAAVLAVASKNTDTKVATLEARIAQLEELLMSKGII